MDIAIVGSDLMSALIIFGGFVMFVIIVKLVDTHMTAKKKRDEAARLAEQSRLRMQAKGLDFVNKIRRERPVE